MQRAGIKGCEIDRSRERVSRLPAPNNGEAATSAQASASLDLSLDVVDMSPEGHSEVTLSADCPRRQDHYPPLERGRWSALRASTVLTVDPVVAGSSPVGLAWNCNKW